MGVTNAGDPVLLPSSQSGYYLKDDGTWAVGVGGGDVSVSGTPTDGQVAIWTDATTIEGSAVGVVRIAANNSSVAAKVAALASGGLVCDDTADDVQFNALIDAIAGGIDATLVISPGAYFGDEIVVHTGVNIHAEVGATITPEATDKDIIEFESGSGCTGELRLLPKDKNSYTATACTITGTTNSTIRERNWHKIGRITIDADSDQGTCLKLQPGAENAGLGHVDVDFACWGGAIGLHLLTTHDGSWINENVIRGLVNYSQTLIYFEDDVGLSDAVITNNKLYVDLEGNNTTDYGIRCSGTVHGNYWKGCLMDCGDITTYILDLDDGSHGTGRNVWEFDATDLFIPAHYAKLRLGPYFVDTFIDTEWQIIYGSQKHISKHPLYNIFNDGVTVYDYNDSGIREGTLGETVIVGEGVYYKSDSKWWLAKADAVGTSAMDVGICVKAGGANDHTIVVTEGYVRDTTWNWGTIGGPIYISAATAGALTETAPVGTPGFVVREIGRVMDADSIHVHILGWEVLT